MIVMDNKMRRDSDEDENEKLLREAGGMSADDGKDHLRADVMGSIAGANPSDPGYLGKIDSMITAHGAVDRLPAPTMGATPGVAPGAPLGSIPLPAGRMNPPSSPDGAVDNTTPPTGMSPNRMTAPPATPIRRQHSHQKGAQKWQRRH